MKKLMKLTTVSLLILLTNCITPPKAVDVDSTKTMSPAERQQIFESNKIKEGGLFTSYQVGTESYAGEQLTPLFDATYASEDAKSKYSSGQTLNTIGSIFAMGGGFAIGWNLGTASRGQSADPGLYIGGGVAILTAFVFGYFATLPFSFHVNLFKANERYREWFGDDYMDKVSQNPIYFMGFMAFMLSETFFQTAVDIGVGMIGVVLFTANLLVYGTVHAVERTEAFLSDLGNGNLVRDILQTVNPYNPNTYKNLDNPSKWRAPEGKGRFKNWNRPGKWRL